MSVYQANTVFLVKLSESEAFTHDTADGYTSGVAHPQSFVAQCNGAEWRGVAIDRVPAEVARLIAHPPGVAR